MKKLLTVATFATALAFAPIAADASEEDGRDNSGYVVGGGAGDGTSIGSGGGMVVPLILLVLVAAAAAS